VALVTDVAARQDDARSLWRLVDQVKAEARDLRQRASELDREAERLTSIAAAVSDGRTIEEGVRDV